MKRYTTTPVFAALAAVALLVLSCGRPSGGTEGQGGTEGTEEAVPRGGTARDGTAQRLRAALAADGFSTLVLLPTTPVKNQSSTPLCWLYAMTATIETEHIGQGDSVNLSTDFTARQYLSSLARRYFFTRRAEDLSLRGTAPMGVALLRRYGAMPYDSYHSGSATVTDGPSGVRTSCPPAPPYRSIARRLMLASRSQPSAAAYGRVVERLLDEAVGAVPPHVFMLGAEYSPRDFAQSVCRAGEWRPLTSFSHHPFGRDIDLELADNRLGQRFMNVPVDSLVAIIKASLRDGHPVCWEGDVSEPGFGWADGVADVPASTPLTQARRQLMFERRQTTDDHCMALVGMARRKSDGTLFFIAKNSWGDSNRLHGFMLLSERYVRMKTVAAVVKSEEFK